MSILSVDNISPIGSGTSVTVNSAATLVLTNANSTGVVTATSFVGCGANLTGVLSNIVEDTSPQLGGNLDTNSHNILLDDSHYLYLGDTQDASLFNDGSNVYLKNYSGGTDIQGTTYVQLRKFNNSSIGLKYIVDGAVELYHGGTKKFETTSYGIDVSGSVHSNGDLLLNDDNQKILIGGANDLRLFHDGTHSRITNITGFLALQSDSFRLYNAAGSENMIDGTANGSVNLYYDNSKKFETTSSGATITGNLAFPSGNGIDFSATSGTPSNGGELLDDYEEGNFTPSLGGVSNWSSYSVTGTGHYVKIGKAVHININFGNVNLNDSASGSVIIFNLPFTPFVIGDCRGVSSNYMSHKVQHANDGMIHSFYIHPTYGFRGQITKNNSDWTSWDASNFTRTGVYLDFSATYFTAS